MNSTNNLVAVKQETINSVMIDILKGVQTAGGEIYGASKVGIAKAVEFAQAEAPIVVQEFLTWKFWEAVIDLFSRSLAPLAVLIVFIAIWKWSKTFRDEVDRGMSRGLSLFLVCAFLAIYFSEVSITAPIKTALQIKLAPRVYLIEYVSKAITK